MANVFHRLVTADSPGGPRKLPANRRGVFFDVMANHWRAFFCYGLLFLVFAIPMHALAVGEEILVRLAYAQDLPQLQLTVHGIQRLFAALKILGFLILAVPVAGFARVVRQYAWMQCVDFWPEFMQGVSENIRQTLLLALLAGLLQFAAAFGYYTALDAQNPASAVFLLIPLGFLMLVGVPVGGYMAFSISMYSDSFLGHLRTGLLLFTELPGKSLVAAGCCMGVFAVQFIPYLLCMFFGRILSSLLVPVLFLGWYLFALNQADRLIHADRFPEYVGKGLAKEE